MQYLLIWLAFDLLVYLYMWYDTKEHNYHVKETLDSFKQSLSNIKDSFTQDE